MKNLTIRIVVLVLVIFIILNNFIFFPGNILSWDVFGYYLYLPLKFIYNDLGISNDLLIPSIIEKYHNTATFYQAMEISEGHSVMKYSMGLSILYAPFFFIAHLVAIIFKYPADGFSYPYQLSIFIGGIIYSILGILVLAKVLMYYFDQKITSMILVIIVFATNFIIHMTMYGHNAMSHNHLFLAYSLIIWLSILWHKSYKLKHIIFLAIVCGITILSRPSEIVCLLIPLLWGIYDKKTAIEKKNLLIKYKIQIIVFSSILLVIGAPQFIYWKIFAGKFLFNSYGGNAGEGFEFFSPYILNVLFSFRKGWLIYTPVMIIGLTGFVLIYKKNKSLFYALFIYFIFNLYIVSSWTCWWYAQSFSQRALIPSYIIMAISLGYFLNWLRDQKKIILTIGYIFIIGCIYLNIFQSIQFHKGIIDGDRMTKKYYFAVFGKMSATNEDKKLLLISRSFDGIEKFNNPEDYKSKLVKKLDFEKDENKVNTFSHSGKYSFRLDNSKIYSTSIETPYYSLTKKDHAWIRVSAYVYPTQNLISNPLSLVIHFNHNDYPYKYMAFDLEKMNLKLNEWNKVSFDYLTPEVRKDDDNLKVYFWFRGNQPVYIDDLQVNVSEEK